MKTKNLITGLGAAALLLAGGLAAGGTASAATADGVDVHHVPQLSSGPVEWSADRMRSAVPADALVADKVAAAEAEGGASSTSTDVATGAPSAVDGVAVPRAAAADPESPVPTIGKVFFTLGGTDYVCSGNSVASSNGSTVSTAGHCLNEGPGTFASNWVFVPAYENGSAPYGQWAATELIAPTQWSRSGDITYDTGFAVVSGGAGQSLSSTVGASGVAFNQARGQSYTAYGYPAAAPFTGQTLQSCAGTATADPFGQSQSQGIPCDMTGGSSGGPWFTGGGSAGVQNSVNSFGYDSVADTMFGPYWGSVIQSAYTEAAG